MIEILVGYDDNDSELGDFFEESFEDLESALAGKDPFNLTSLTGLECTEENVVEIVDSFNASPFVFVGLSHGNKFQLLTDNDVYVDSNNVSHFKNSLFYSPACKTAINLGLSLINDECSVYIGCYRNTYATFDNFYSTYIECENYCLKQFLLTDTAIGDSYTSMLEFFDDKIDFLYEQNDAEILLAMELQHNKDSFDIIGNKALTRLDLQSP